METSILTEIARVEKEMEESLRQERVIAERLIEETRKSIEESIRAKDEELNAKIESAIATARQEAVADGKRLIEDAEKRARLLLGIDDEFLVKILMGSIKRVLPGRDH